MVSGRASWRASEAVARDILESLGYRVLEMHKKIVIDGVEVGEADIIAEKDGELYAVEVKAGLLDVSGVRQAHVNAKLLGYKPLAIARGIDEKASKLAEKLGVELIILSDIIYAGTDELRMLIREAVYDAINNLLEVFTKCDELSGEDLKTIAAIAKTDTIKEAAESLGVSIDDFARNIGALRRKGILPRGNYELLRLAARLLLACELIGKGDVPRP